MDKRADGDSDNGTIYNAEQATRCKLNKCYSGKGINNDRRSDSTREGTLNYDVCTASILGRYEEKNFGNTVPASGTYNVSTEDRTITKDQICKVVNEVESLTPDKKQKLSDILLKYQESLTKKPDKCKNFEYTFRQNYRKTFSPTVPPSAARISRSLRHLVAKVGTSKRGGKQRQTTPKNLPRMQRTRAIPVD